jgi:deoxyribose-phosphate aldolase
MHIEYCLYDHALSEKEVLENINHACQKGIQYFSLLPYSISSLKNSGLLKNIKIGTPLDYPYGIMDIKSRKQNAEILLGEYNLNTLDIVAPSKMLSNNKYSKIKEDLDNLLEVIEPYNVNIRYILEYRMFSYAVLTKLCQILDIYKIATIIPSTGRLIDDINDHVIAYKYLESKSNIQTIFSANLYTNHQVDYIKKLNPYGIRLFNTNSIDLLCQNNFCHQKN